MSKIKPIIGYERLYSVTDNGRVFAHERIARHNSPSGFQIRKEKWLKPLHNKVTGYYYVCLYDNEENRRNHYIHVLVMTMFGEEKPTKKHQVNHKDLDKSNNRKSNLEWKTPKGNIKHAHDNGHAPDINKTKHIGEDNGKAKLTEKDVIYIRNIYESGDKGLGTLAKEFSVSKYCIYAIIHRKSWNYL